MATCHAGKNLREENGDGKPAQAAKARLRQFGLLLPALAFVKWNENVVNLESGTARSQTCEQLKNQREWFTITLKITRL